MSHSLTKNPQPTLDSYYCPRTRVKEIRLTIPDECVAIADQAKFRRIVELLAELNEVIYGNDAQRYYQHD